MAGQCRRNGLGVRVVPGAFGRRRAGFGNFKAQVTHFTEFRNAQTLDLFFERANACHLTDIGRDTPEQAVTRDVESAGRDVAPVRFGLHRFRPGQLLAQIRIHAGVDLLVGRDQPVARSLILGGLCGIEFRRRDKTALRKILIARRFRLAVPKNFVFHFARREFADAFEAENGVTQVRDRLVTVLEVKTLQELLRVMRAHPLNRLPDGIGRAAVARQSVSALLRRQRCDSDDAFSQTVIITVDLTPPQNP